MWREVKQTPRTFCMRIGWGDTSGSPLIISAGRSTSFGAGSESREDTDVLNGPCGGVPPKRRLYTPGSGRSTLHAITCHLQSGRLTPVPDKTPGDISGHGHASDQVIQAVRIAQANLKHGYYAKAARQERRDYRALVKRLRQQVRELPGCLLRLWTPDARKAPVVSI